MKTKFDLYKSASDAAATTLDANTFNAATALMEAFRAGKFDPHDYEFFGTVFWERREFFLNLRRQPAPSEAAAAAATAKPEA